jgi:hypothetical protein
MKPLPTNGLKTRANLGSKMAKFSCCREGQVQWLDAHNFTKLLDNGSMIRMIVSRSARRT